VGPAIAGHTIVLGGRRGELVIGVDSPAWASELSLLAEDLLERVRQESGNTPVRGIRFAVTRDAQRSHAVAAAEEATASGYEVRVEPVPLDEAEMNRVQESVADVKDASLREAALRAIVADLEWKKGISSANGREGGAPRPTGRKSD
jgi:hypothetical protein